MVRAICLRLQVGAKQVGSKLEEASKRCPSGESTSGLNYRLNVFPIHIHMPALRNRMEDIPSLVERLIARCAAEIGKNVRRLDKASLAQILSYDWPGNIRELQNVLERAVILCEGETAHIEEDWLNSFDAAPEFRGS